MRNYDAIIIGAGVIGAATSLSLSRKGWKVLSIDKLPAAGYGSTSGSCAIIRPYYSTVDASAIAFESHHYWRDWQEFLGFEDERGFARYNNCGALVTKTPHNNELRDACAIMDELGASYEHLSVAQMQQKLPMLCKESYYPVRRIDDENFGVANEEELIGAVFFHQAGYVSDPQLATHNLQRAAEQSGAQFRFNIAVSEIVQQSGRVTGIRTQCGEGIAAPVVINIAGPHSAKVNAMAGVDQTMKIKTRALRHEVAHVPAPHAFDYEHAGCIFSDSDIGGYMRPEVGNNILLGSEDPPCDDHAWVDPDDFNRGFSTMWQSLVMRAAQRIPELGIPNTAKGVVELYDVTDDWAPIYDASDLPGFYMAVGTSGNQFKNAPVAGQIMADIVESMENGGNHDIAPVDFHLRYIDHTISTAMFSRNRLINPDSSFSVLG
ncbi:MAG: NAD(P)/FAD-dependent oxidoreductase [Pseudomonadales bacterium]